MTLRKVYGRTDTELTLSEESRSDRPSVRPEPDTVAVAHIDGLLARVEAARSVAARERAVDAVVDYVWPEPEWIKRMRQGQLRAKALS